MKPESFDPANHLNDPPAITDYLNRAFETEDPSHIAEAIGVLVRAYGVDKIASASQLSRENVYRAFSSQGYPKFGTILRVLKALGYRLEVVKN